MHRWWCSLLWIYVAKDGIVTVDWDRFTKWNQAGENALETARQLLRELVHKHQKEARKSARPVSARQPAGRRRHRRKAEQ